MSRDPSLLVLTYTFLKLAFEGEMETSVNF